MTLLYVVLLQFITALRSVTAPAPVRLITLLGCHCLLLLCPLSQSVSVSLPGCSQEKVVGGGEGSSKSFAD